jgi:hypothetical protein
MTNVQSQTCGTVFDTLLKSLQRAADYHSDDAVPPAAILWPDEKKEWEPLVPRLRMLLPQLLVFGPYDFSKRTGPAIWLRCVLAHKISTVPIAKGVVPILYLPGVSRATLRATDECPVELKPLAELQYRGNFWSQYNGKDWTVAAFLQTNHGGLQLKIAKDNATSASIRRALEKLVDIPVTDLQGKANSGELNSGYFDSLVSDDLVDDLLSWLSDPRGTKDRWETSRWEILRGRCISDYGFDPTKDGELVGAEKLGLQTKTSWKAAWKRFTLTPSRYAGLIELLRKAKPSEKEPSLIKHSEEPWPQDNEAEELSLRGALSELGSIPVAEARTELLALERKHGIRRNWVWAKMQRSPLAQVMEHLAILAETTKHPLTGATTKDMVDAYVKDGWRADAAVLDAIASATQQSDHDVVAATIAQVYSPWLRDAAELFQERLKLDPLPGRDVPRLADVPTGTCVFFADGLRFDVGQKLKMAIETKVGRFSSKHHFSAMPSVTPTAKPAVSPVAAMLTGSQSGEDFRPCVRIDSKDLTHDRFRKLLDEEGFQYLTMSETGNPSGRAWTEFSGLDKAGHAEGSRLALRIPELISTIIYRVEKLLAAGWKEVRIVTDHGWLLLPGGLPKTDLPRYLTATRWRRCAVVKESASVELTCFSWFWNEDVQIASPPGIDCFISGEEYHHGGLSLQECVVPQFSIRSGLEPAATAKIESVKWSRLRCRIKVTGQYEGCRLDLRDKPADATTSLVEAKPIGTDGNASLVVLDDSRDQSATTLVVIDAAGNVIDKKLVTVGE